MRDEKRIEGSFDALRLIAALTVFHSHQIVLSGGTDPRPTWFTTYSAAAVCAFFGISGYLITRSALFRDLPTFFAFRALRLLPALIACVFLTIIAMGYFSALTYWDYISRPDTWSYLRNIAVFFTPGQRGLPGVFEGTFDPVVNGPLWTLPYEVLCYILIGVVVAIGRRTALVVSLIICAACAAAFKISPAYPILMLLDGFSTAWLSLFALAFFASAAVALLGSQSLRWALLLVTALMVAFWSVPSWAFLISAPFIGLWVVWLGRTIHLDRYLRRVGDLSYGVYIYGFPIQRITIGAFEGHPSAFALSYAVALAGTVALAFISWRLIERPALSAKKLFGRRDAAAVAQAAG